MQERRKTNRLSISYYLRVLDADTNQMIGHLADISLQGLRMDSQKPIPVKKEYRLRINIAADVGDKDYIDFVASSRWCERDPLQTGLYEVGFEIVKIDRLDVEIIQRIMEKYCIKENTSNW
jgi:hypothetical protein